MVAVHNIIERKQTEIAMRHEHDLVSAVLDTTAALVVMLDQQGRITRFNRACEQITGHTFDEVIGKTVWDLFLLPGDIEPVKAVFENLKAGIFPNTHENYWVARDGSRRLISWANSILLDPDGSVKYIIGTGIDITEHRQAEEQTKRRLQRLAALREIDRAIAGSMDLHLSLKTVLDQACAQLHVDAADVLLLDPHTQTLEYAAGYGFRTGALQFTRLRLGQGHAGQAGLQRQVVHIPDLRNHTTDFLRSPLLASEGFITYFGVPLIAKGQVKGVLEVFLRSLFQPDDEWSDFLETLAGQAAIAIDSVQLFESLQRSNVELALAYDATIEGWSRAMDIRDKETEGHTQRVTEMTVQLAHAMGMSESEVVHVRRGALLHDMGKLGIPDGILHKPGALNAEEWDIMRQHPQHAHDMLSPIAYLRPALDIPYCHHEKWDGTGYPRGLKGEEIPLAARIFAVVDMYDALTSERHYHAALPQAKAIGQIRDCAGTHFDQQVVETFLKVAAE